MKGEIKMEREKNVIIDLDLKNTNSHQTIFPTF